jgi:hypothetical protein
VKRPDAELRFFGVSLPVQHSSRQIFIGERLTTLTCAGDFTQKTAADARSLWAINYQLTTIN